MGYQKWLNEKSKSKAVFCYHVDAYVARITNGRGGRGGYRAVVGKNEFRVVRKLSSKVYEHRKEAQIHLDTKK